MLAKSQLLINNFKSDLKAIIKDFRIQKGYPTDIAFKTVAPNFSIVDRALRGKGLTPYKLHQLAVDYGLEFIISSHGVISNPEEYSADSVLTKTAFHSQYKCILKDLAARGLATVYGTEYYIPNEGRLGRPFWSLTEAGNRRSLPQTHTALTIITFVPESDLIINSYGMALEFDREKYPILPTRDDIPHELRRCEYCGEERPDYSFRTKGSQKCRICLNKDAKEYLRKHRLQQSETLKRNIKKYVGMLKTVKEQLGLPTKRRSLTALDTAILLRSPN